MKKKPRSITVITTQIQHRVHYVRKCTSRQDGRYNVELTADLKEAKDFASWDTQELLPKLFNPHDRKFVVEDTLINQ